MESKAKFSPRHGAPVKSEQICLTESLTAKFWSRSKEARDLKLHRLMGFAVQRCFAFDASCSRSGLPSPLSRAFPLVMKKILLPALVFCAALSATAAAPDKEKLKIELAAMEEAFCAMAKEKGIRAAFEYFAAPDVAFLDPDPRKWRGLAAVEQRIGPDQPGVTLTWSASFTDVSDDGTLGYNYGRYESRRPGPDGKATVRTGWFLTIWKRQPDGTWRYVMDNGTPDKPATVPKSEAPPKPAAANSEPEKNRGATPTTP
jgi:ketosteroid isomerase-like protein